MSIALPAALQGQSGQRFEDWGTANCTGPFLEVTVAMWTQLQASAGESQPPAGRGALMLKLPW